MRRYIPMIVAVELLLLAAIVPGRAQQVEQATEAQLERWLRQYPEADANRDGKLTLEEAQAYRRKLDQERLRRKPPQERFPFAHEFAFATMSDGVKIALAVGYPDGFSPDSNRKWPAIFTTCGYTGATAPIDPASFGQRCVTVNASIRGTGASGGTLIPWRPRTWQDGYEIIEEWIAKRPWSDGKVGIVGHSWPGLMGFFVATTNPPSLKAVCVSGLLEDFYRGISRIGGVRNSGFPVSWLNSYYRTDGPFSSGIAAKVLRGLDDFAYDEILGSRPMRDLSEDMLWLLLYEEYDGPTWRNKALGAYASRIRAPILMMHTYQDEQTGPSGLWLWKYVPDDVPKRLILSNGAHNVAPASNPDLAAWFQHGLLGEGDGSITDSKRRVQVYFDTALDRAGKAISLNPPLEAADFPLPDTRWTRFYLRSGRTLSRTPPGKNDPPHAYRVESGEPEDENEHVDYVLEFDEPTAICGPITLTLWAQLTTLDADFFALLGDLTPDGKLFGLQRGLLRASHHPLDEEKSTYLLHDGQKLLLRPHHPHDRAVPITPHRPYRFEIEVFVVGHVFRAGHKLVLRVSRPPLGDPIGVTKSGGPSYRYDSDQPPGIVTVLHDAEHPSSLLLPVLPTLPPVSSDPSDPPPIENLAGLQEVR